MSPVVTIGPQPTSRFCGMMSFTRKSLMNAIAKITLTGNANWECKLGALAHLLSVAEAKWAITTVHGHLDTQYIEASRCVCNACDAIDRHSQSWAMCTTELASIVPDTGTKHAPANNSGPEQAPTTGAPPPGSTTHHFITQEGNKAY